MASFGAEKNSPKTRKSVLNTAVLSETSLKSWFDVMENDWFQSIFQKLCTLFRGFSIS